MSKPRLKMEINTTLFSVEGKKAHIVCVTTEKERDYQTFYESRGRAENNLEAQRHGNRLREMIDTRKEC